MKRKFISFIQYNHNYWQIDKLVYQLLGPTTTILLSEYILQADLIGDNHFFRSRKQIEKSTGIERTVQFRNDQKLIALKLLRIDNNKKTKNRTMFSLRKKNVRKFLVNPLKYVAKLQHDKELLKLVKVIELKNEGVAKQQHMLEGVATQQHVIYKYSIYNNKLFVNIKDINSILSVFKKTLERLFSQAQTNTTDKKSKDGKKLKTLMVDINIPVECKYPIQQSDVLTYDLLVNAGASKHRLTSTKSLARTLDSIHQLLSKKCKNPYLSFLQTPNGKKFYKYYAEKRWTQEELLDAFKYYLETTDGKNRTIYSFIFLERTSIQKYSPLVVYHNKLKESRKQREEFNGTAKRIYDFIEKKQGAPSIFSNVLFIKTGKLVDKLNNTHAVNPVLLPPENTIAFQFTQYLGERLRSSNFKLPYMASDNFITQFVTEAEKYNKLVKKSDLRRIYGN